jgi:hypothetical protein
LKNKELEGQGATLAKNKRITFGRTFGVQFYCDTITKKYAYEVARTNVKEVRWSDAHADKAAWHLRLAQLIANELSREVCGNPNGLACAVQKDLMHWIIDSGSGFDLISGRSLTKNDRRVIIKTNNLCRMATANGVATADEQLSVHIDGIGSTGCGRFEQQLMQCVVIGKAVHGERFRIRMETWTVAQIMAPGRYRENFGGQPVCSSACISISSEKDQRRRFARQSRSAARGGKGLGLYG